MLGGCLVGFPIMKTGQRERKTLLFLEGGGSKPITIIFGGTNIHSPAILGYHLGTRVLTHRWPWKKMTAEEPPSSCGRFEDPQDPLAISSQHLASDKSQTQIVAAAMLGSPGQNFFFGEDDNDDMSQNLDHPLKICNQLLVFLVFLLSSPFISSVNP